MVSYRRCPGTSLHEPAAPGDRHLRARVPPIHAQACTHMDSACAFMRMCTHGARPRMQAALMHMNVHRTSWVHVGVGAVHSHAHARTHAHQACLASRAPNMPSLARVCMGTGPAGCAAVCAPGGAGGGAAAAGAAAA